MPDLAVLNLIIVDGVTQGVPIEGPIESFKFDSIPGGVGGDPSGFAIPSFEKRFIVTRAPDEFSNRLAQLFFTAEVLDQVLISQNSFSGDATFSSTIATFRNAVITSMNRFDPDGGGPVDQITFDFESS